MINDTQRVNTDKTEGSTTAILNFGSNIVDRTPVYNEDETIGTIESSDTNGEHTDAIVTAVIVFLFPFAVLSVICLLRHRVSKRRQSDIYRLDKKGLEYITTSTYLPVSSADTHLTNLSRSNTSELRRYKMDCKLLGTNSTLVDILSKAAEARENLSEPKDKTMNNTEHANTSVDDNGVEIQHTPLLEVLRSPFEAAKNDIDISGEHRLVPTDEVKID